MRCSCLTVSLCGASEFISEFYGLLEPPANKNFALNSIIGAAFGAAGQRCMAISVGASAAF
jgi:hypothetical protein